MFDAKQLLDQFMGGQTPAGGAGQASPGGGGVGGLLSSPGAKGLAGGAVAGGLAALLLGNKKARKMAGGVLGYGGAAVVGGLAYKAYSDWQARKAGGTGATPPSPPAGGAGAVPSVPAQTDAGFLPPPDDTAAMQDLNLALMRAMIAAAKADGHVDATEQSRIFEKLDEFALDTEAKAFVIDELRKPLDIDSVVSAATSPEIAADIYAASCLAIDPDDPAEQAYLTMLASRLQLDPELKALIEEQAAQANAVAA